MKAAVIGAGVMGAKRAASCLSCGVALTHIADTNTVAAHKLAQEFRASACTPEQALASDADLVFVSTTHDALSQWTQKAAMAGKHVLVEKPAAKRAEDLEPLKKSMPKSVFVKVGFNHRFHPMIARAKQLVDQGALGDLLCMTGEYGHGGREGMQNEWRCNKSQSGGGELLDQGSHLIDLYRWFFGEPASVSAKLSTYVWKSGDPVEDNTFFTLQDARKRVGQFHASWTLWKNSFQFKIIGSKAMIHVCGRGKSYGKETLKVFNRGEEGIPCLEEEYEGEDRSFVEELQYFIACINNREKPVPGIDDAQKTLRIVEDLYARAV